MASELERQVAEARCTCSNGRVECTDGIHYMVRGDYELSCGLCLGTGLRWPSLSYSTRNGNPNYARMPDVTLDKVLDIFEQGGLQYEIRNSNIQVWIPRSKVRGSEPTCWSFAYTDERLDAACTALLASTA